MEQEELIASCTTVLTLLAAFRGAFNSGVQEGEFFRKPLSDLVDGHKEALVLLATNECLQIESGFFASPDIAKIRLLKDGCNSPLLAPFVRQFESEYGGAWRG